MNTISALNIHERGIDIEMTDYEKAVSLWQQKHITTDAELAEALNGHSIAFAYHSGRLENDNITYHDTREIFEHDGVTSYTGDLRTLFEIRNAKDANEFLLTAFNQKLAFDEYLIKEFHNFVIGKEEIGASPEDVQEEISELLSELKDIQDKDALTAAAYFHAKFENIHPFADGNGRTGRLTMNYFLIIHNHPPIIIHEEERKAYFTALEEWDSKQALEPLCTFLKEQTIETWKKQIERAEKKQKL